MEIYSKYFTRKFIFLTGVALTRNERKVNTMCYKFGFEHFSSGYYQDSEVDFIIGFRDKVGIHPNNQIENMISFFWDKRIDYTNRLKI